MEGTSLVPSWSRCIRYPRLTSTELSKVLRCSMSVKHYDAILWHNVRKELHLYPALRHGTYRYVEEALD